MRPQDTAAPAMAGGDQSAAPVAPAPKTPADFQAETERFNASLDASLRDLAHAQNEITRCMAEREMLIGRAGEFGVTGKFARTILRKA